MQADINAVNRAENTLKTWAIPDEDIQAVRDEVKDIAAQSRPAAEEKDRLKQWARVELKAPDDGFIIEQNVALHETVVDNTTNLFQIAKVDPLIVLAAVPEDDLPALQDLKSQTQNFIGWTVRTVGAEPIAGLVDDIGYLIDPNQHTAVVRGHIPNPNGLLRAGQFVTATVELLPPKNVVEVPIGALVEDGKDSIVFVQTDPAKAHLHDAPRAGDQSLRPNGLCPQRRPWPRTRGRAGRGRAAIACRRSRCAGRAGLTAGALELKTALASKLREQGIGIEAIR